jgi:hypothetical protein
MITTGTNALASSSSLSSRSARGVVDLCVELNVEKVLADVVQVVVVVDQLLLGAALHHGGRSLEGTDLQSGKNQSSNFVPL